MRKFAIKGMVFLAVAVSLSLYFSGTIRAILTPKVQFLIPQKGQLTQKFQIPCSLTFTHQEPLYFPVEDPVVVKQVFVRMGDKVQAGDALFELQLLNESAMEKDLDQRYKNALLNQLDFKRRNADVVLTDKEKNYLATFKTLQAATLREVELEKKVRQFSSASSFSLSDGNYPEGAGTNLMAAVDAWRAANTQKIEAETAFMAFSKLRLSNKAQAYISEYQIVEAQLFETQTALQDFNNKKESIRLVTAPSNGYVASLHTSAREEYYGKSPLCILTKAEGEALLKVSLKNVKRLVSDGTSVLVETQVGSFKGTVREIGLDDEGEKYAMLDIPDHLLALLPLRLIEKTPMTAHITVVSPEQHSLVPMSAVHGTQGQRFVYVVKENQPAVGNIQMRVEKLNITVLDEADGMAAVEQDLSHARLAYYEDRPLDDGAFVVGYSK